MKTLANCNPVEFFVQTNRIRKAVWDWLSLTKVLEIRKNIPPVKEDATPEEKRQIMTAQIRKNAGAMLDSMLGEHPRETAELLGLLCFVEPEDLPNHQMREFLGAISELISTPEVIDFFISLTQLDQMTGSNTAAESTSTSSPFTVVAT